MMDISRIPIISTIPVISLQTAEITAPRTDAREFLLPGYPFPGPAINLFPHVEEDRRA
jgi:hypothetical protein